MTPWPTQHFTAEDLDAFHVEALSSEMQLHLETCDECRRMVALDRKVLAMMTRLPSYGPKDGFADRVMARVVVGSPAPVPVLSYPKLTRPRLVALTALAAGLVASIAWSSANRAILDGWLDGGGATVWNWGNTIWQQSVAFLASQPWYEGLRAMSAGPGRMAILAVATIGLYTSGLIALRRLVAPSSGSVSDVRA
jgi:hypothetical protein